MSSDPSRTLDTRVEGYVNYDADAGPGDKVEVSVTHEVKINYDKAWVKAGVVTVVREGETGDEAGARAIRFVNTQVMNGVVKAVEAVNNFEGTR